MNTDLDKLRRLFQGYAAARKPSSREGCPSASELTESFEPTCPGRRKRRIIDHVTSCPACREEFTMLLERQRRDDGACERAPQDLNEDATAEWAGRRQGSRRSPLWQYAGAVLGLGLIVISVIVVKDQWRQSVALRSAQPRIALEAPRMGQAVSGPLTFRWRGQAHSEYYMLELFDDALLPVWSSDKITDGRLVIPGNVLSHLSPGKTYYWMVTGFSDGTKREESPLGRFRVRD